MFLISLLFSALSAYGQWPEKPQLCGQNIVQSEDPGGINKICFIKIENLKDSWQVRFHLNDGSTRNYFMKDPSYDQSLSIGQERTVLKAQLYNENDTGVVTGDIGFFYPLNKLDPEFIVGSIPSGHYFHILNMGAPGLKAPNRD